MSMFPEDPEHFIRWVIASGEPGAPAYFAKRSMYRSYLQGISDEVIATGRVHTIQDTASGLETSDSGWLCTLAGGGTVSASNIVLAFGVGSPASLQVAQAVVDHPAYIGDIWSGNQKMPEGARSVGLIGSGLTAIDVVLSGEAQGLSPHYTLISRHGFLPQRHATGHGDPVPAPPMVSAIRTLVRSIRSATSGVADWRSVLDAMRPHLTEYWLALSERDQAMFLHHLRPYWEVHRHRMPPQVADKVDQLVGEGRLTVRAAHIKAIEADGDALRMRFEHGEEAMFDAVINCTGLPSAPAWDSPLLRQLVSEGYAKFDRHNLGLECDAEGRIVGKHTGANLFAIGFLRRGQLYESTAARELGIQAGEIARTISAGFGA